MHFNRVAHYEIRTATSADRYSSEYIDGVKKIINIF